MDPAAVMTSAPPPGGSASHPPSCSPSTHPECRMYSNWRLWGQWGPLDSVVNHKRLDNIHRFLKERIETNPTRTSHFITSYLYLIATVHVPFVSTVDCVLQANGNVYDAEGFLVSSGSEFDSHHLTNIAATASLLRSGLARMDSDITRDAVPHPQTGLNKSLLRIVLSGCVATSVYLPSDLSSLYVIQVGDCGAVLGRFIGKNSSTSSSASAAAAAMNSEDIQEAGSDSSKMEDHLKSVDPCDWEADLLVAPHNAQNLRDVERLQSQHPIHEASLMIVEDRLLC